MTIFNLTARQDLQHAFDLISQMLSPTDQNGSTSMNTCALFLRAGLRQARSKTAWKVPLLVLSMGCEMSLSKQYEY